MKILVTGCAGMIGTKLVEMLIKSCTKKYDDCFILFGGSGSELVLCKQLKRNFVSCEIHSDYYKMILDRLKNNGKIKDEYRLLFKQKENCIKNKLYSDEKQVLMF